MKLYQLRSTQNKKILFEGKFETFKDCVESAVLQKIPLPYIDLSHQNLTNANLDDAIMPHADFTQSNLSGANISEAYVSGARFTNASLYNTCFCDSNLAGSNFNGAFFGGTDIFGSIISRSQFSTLSAFSLDFTAARQMNDCIYITAQGQICRMSRPPIVISGIARKPIVVMDDTIKAGNNMIDYRRLAPLAQKLAARTLRNRLPYTKARA